MALPIPSTNNQSFVHRPLRLDKQQIRLFRFRPHLAETETSSDLSRHPIAGSIELFDLDQCPNYQALSYEWGTEDDTQTMLIDGKSFTIRKNLYDFFQTIRTVKFSLTPNVNDRSGECYFWIDQLCIDQQNSQERNHQVSLMKDIYSKALRVLAWLGVTSTPFALAEILERFQEDQELEIRFAISKHLASSSYWTRLWINQEVLLAGDLLIVYGKQSWTRDMLRIGDAEQFPVTKNVKREKRWQFELFGRDLLGDDRIPMLAQVMKLIHGESDIPVSLEEAMLYYMPWRLCSNVLDRIYGLQGIVVDEDHLPVDYDIAPIELYARVLSVVRRSTYYEELFMLDVEEGHPLKKGETLDEAAQGLRSQIMKGLAIDLGIPADTANEKWTELFEKTKEADGNCSTKKN